MKTAKKPRKAPIFNYGYDADPVEYDDRFHGPDTHEDAANKWVAEYVEKEEAKAKARLAVEIEVREAEKYAPPDEPDGPVTDYAQTVHRYKGRPVVVPEWLPSVVRDRMVATNAKGQAYSAMGNVVIMLSQILYWAEPNKKGIPRSSGKNRHFSPNDYGSEIYEGHRGYWFVRCRSSVLRNRLYLSRGAIEVALNKLVALQLIKKATPDATKKHKKIYVRVLYQNFVGDVAQWQEENLARLTEQDKRRNGSKKDKKGEKKPVPVES